MTRRLLPYLAAIACAVAWAGFIVLGLVLFFIAGQTTGGLQ